MRFHVTVAVGPPEASPPDLAPEVGLVKAALLYGDRVALVSPAASLLRRLTAEAHLARTPRQRLALLASLADDLGLGDAPTVLSAHSGEPGIEATVARIWNWFSVRLEAAHERSGLHELAVAERAGVLDIVDLTAAEAPTDLAATAADHYAARVTEAVVSGATHALFDRATGDRIRRDLRLTGVRENRLRHIGLAESIVGRLPLFDLATVAETLDVRRDLGRYLARFREAISTFSSTIASAPWDADFPAEAERVYIRDVAPAVAEVDDVIASTGYLRALATRYADRPTLLAPLAAPALSLALAGPDLLANAVGLAMGAASVGANALTARHEAADRRREAEAHRVYFYYAARQRFG
ncbi:MAG: hypothetical protein AAGI52_13170 [Bacteroidota bacterium]